MTTSHNWPTLSGAQPLLIAHRGASAYLPDHTLEGYRHAALLGADFIEPDVVSTRDGVLIVRHEPNLKDTTDIALRPEFAHYHTEQVIDGVTESGWFAHHMTYAEIQTLRAVQPLPFRPQHYNGRFQIPTLEQVMQLRQDLTHELGREIGIYPETKHPSWHQQHGLALEPPLLELIQKFGLDHVAAPIYIQSFELANLRSLKLATAVKLVYLIDGLDILADGRVTSTVPYDFQLQHDQRTYSDMLLPQNLAEIAQVVHAIGPWKIHLCPFQTHADGRHTLMPNHALIAHAHALNLEVVPFTFRSEANFLQAAQQLSAASEYQLYFELGVDALFTDQTDVAFACRQEFAQQLKGVL